MAKTSEVLSTESGTAREVGRSMSSKLSGVAAYIVNLPRGDRAELRRIGRWEAEIPPEVFWRIVARYNIAPDEEDFWLAIIPLMVHHEHVRGRKPGRALAEAGVSPARVRKWLRLTRVKARAEAGRLFSQVKTGFDWVKLGFLLLNWKEEDRRTLARGYFLSRDLQEGSAASRGGNTR